MGRESILWITSPPTFSHVAMDARRSRHAHCAWVGSAAGSQLSREGHARTVYALHHSTRGRLREEGPAAREDEGLDERAIARAIVRR